MKLKRGVWIAACLIGVAVFGGLAALLGAMLIWGAEDGVGTPPSFLEWAVAFILVAAACGSALFLAPREIDEITQVEVDEDPAQWVKDMRNRSDTDRNS
jgi:hypothetical protein